MYHLNVAREDSNNFKSFPFFFSNFAFYVWIFVNSKLYNFTRAHNILKIAEGYWTLISFSRFVTFRNYLWWELWTWINNVFLWIFLRKRFWILKFYIDPKGNNTVVFWDRWFSRKILLNWRQHYYFALQQHKQHFLVCLLYILFHNFFVKTTQKLFFQVLLLFWGFFCVLSLSSTFPIGIHAHLLLLSS